MDIKKKKLVKECIELGMFEEAKELLSEEEQQSTGFSITNYSDRIDLINNILDEIKKKSFDCLSSLKKTNHEKYIKAVEEHLDDTIGFLNKALRSIWY